jgi:hypothetical protein
VKQSDALIRNIDGKYWRGRTEIPGQNVQTVAQALKAPPLKRFEISNLITRSWMEETGEVAIQRVEKLQRAPVSPERRADMLRQCEEPRIIESARIKILLDSYAFVEAEVTFQDGERIKVGSTDNGPFMIPWRFAPGNGGEWTFNADISRAIANIVPRTFVNQGLLSGDGLRELVVASVLRNTPVP